MAGVIKWFATGVLVGASSDDHLYGPLGHLVSPNQETESSTSHRGVRVYKVYQKLRTYAYVAHMFCFIYIWSLKTPKLPSEADQVDRLQRKQT